LKFAIVPMPSALPAELPPARVVTVLLATAMVRIRLFQ
jgi:hypothetical protein